VICPLNLRTQEAQATFSAFGVDAAVVAAYGLILLVRSLLLRGSAASTCTPRCCRAGAARPRSDAAARRRQETGITIMQMEEGLDTGPILLQQAVAIAPGGPPQSYPRHWRPSAPADRDALDGVARGTLAAQPQPQEGVTYPANRP